MSDMWSEARQLRIFFVCQVGWHSFLGDAGLLLISNRRNSTEKTTTSWAAASSVPHATSRNALFLKYVAGLWPWASDTHETTDTPVALADLKSTGLTAVWAGFPPPAPNIRHELVPCVVPGACCFVAWLILTAKLTATRLGKPRPVRLFPSY